MLHHGAGSSFHELVSAGCHTPPSTATTWWLRRMGTIAQTAIAQTVPLPGLPLHQPWPACGLGSVAIYGADYGMPCDRTGGCLCVAQRSGRNANRHNRPAGRDRRLRRARSWRMRIGEGPMRVPDPELMTGGEVGQTSMKMHSPGHSSAASITASSPPSGIRAIPSAPAGFASPS